MSNVLTTHRTAQHRGCLFDALTDVGADFGMVDEIYDHIHCLAGLSAGWMTDWLE